MEKVNENQQRVFYLCDGTAGNCKKTFCYKRGGPCRHTENVTHALNAQENRKEFVKIGSSLFEGGYLMEDFK